jgi:hypothetical protein
MSDNHHVLLLLKDIALIAIALGRIIVECVRERKHFDGYFQRIIRSLEDRKEEPSENRRDSRPGNDR